MNERKRTDAVLVFDLGGVLVDFAGFRELRELVPEGDDYDRLRRRWLSSPSVHAYEAGHVTSEAFAEAFVREWGLDMGAPDFMAAFGTWPRGLLPGASEVIERLRTSRELACFSNTNALHWQRVEGMVRGWFGTELLSFRLGYAKPDPKAFREAARLLPSAAEEILFFDDSPANVEAAREAGWSAVRVSGPADVEAYLELSDRL